MEKGYQYLVMSDHSKSAFYAGGLTEAQIIAQHKEIDALNATFTDFHIFKSIECDILNDGSLDYADDVLSSFDLVITSVHQNLKMDIEKATERLLKAIAHPSTRILGHMTGRLILSRPGYPVHHKKIIDACAEHKVVIEINANPYRLDIDYTWIPYAMEKGVLISINPDAHSVDGINDIHWGVVSARKGGLRKAMTLNAKSLEEFRVWLR
jgi:DNA polymerase (family 10)